MYFHRLIAVGVVRHRVQQLAVVLTPVECVLAPVGSVFGVFLSVDCGYSERVAQLRRVPVFLAGINVGHVALVEVRLNCSIYLAGLRINDVHALPPERVAYDLSVLVVKFDNRLVRRFTSKLYGVNL